MSIEIMSAIWPVQFTEKSDKWVMMALADAANPSEGITWLPVESKRGKMDLVAKTQLSPRSIQRSIARLVKEGWLDRFENPGRGVLFRVYSSPVSRGDMVTPPNGGDMVTGVRGDTMTGRGDTMTGKTSFNPKIKKEGELDLSPVDKWDPNRPLPKSLEAWQWDAYVALREAIRKPVVDISKRLLLAKLDMIEREGWHLGDVVERAMVNCWTDFHLPAAGRATGVRRLAGDGTPMPSAGMTEEDMAKAAEADALDDLNDRLVARAELFAKAERTNQTTPLGELISGLPIMQSRDRKRAQKKDSE